MGISGNPQVLSPNLLDGIRLNLVLEIYTKSGQEHFVIPTLQELKPNLIKFLKTCSQVHPQI
jgi:hypothetical protein